MASVKRKRQPEEEKNTRRGSVDVIRKEDNQPQLSRDSQGNCGSKRRRSQEKKEDMGDCIEDTNSMMRRLEDDEGIE